VQEQVEASLAGLSSGLDALSLLRAARRIADQPDLTAAIQEVLRAGHGILGCERVRFFRVFADEGLLRQEGLEGRRQRDASGDLALPLDRSTVLGRMALGGARARVFHLAALGDKSETPGASATYLAPLRLEEATLGVLVADFPQTRREISGDMVQVWSAVIQLFEVALVRFGLGRLRAEFVASVSHELRTPLTSIKAFCEMLSDGDAGPLTEVQLTFVRRIATGSDQLQKIVEDLLELSRLRSGTETARETDICVRPFLEDTALNLAPQAAARGVRITISTPDDLPVLRTDQRRLQQALSNFVDNAIKYSPEGAEVTIAALLAEGELQFCVGDTGPGMPEDELKRIFDEFYRCRNGVNDTTSKGAGLGLAIVARIAEFLGARVGVESGLGEGSRFSLAFPLEKG